MERMVENRLDWVIERSEMLSETQTGFRKNRSTYDQLTSLDDEIHRALSQKHTCIVAYLDLAGAFDAVNHAMVIHKLAAAGITGRLLGWLQAYLQERTFKVLFEGEQSNARPITIGVPQGGILSPLLFNVLMSDFPQTEGVHCSIYADDIAIYASGPDPAIVQNLVQTHLRRIEEWTKKWGQKISAAKSKAMVFGTVVMNPPQPLVLQAVPLEYVDNFRFLGATLDAPKLTWARHINQLKFGCSSRVSLLKSITHNHWGSDRKTLLMLYKSLIRSKMDYASHLYDNGTQSIKNPLDVLQNKCLRICTGLRQTTPIVSLTAEAHIPLLGIRRTFLGLRYFNRIQQQSNQSPIVLRMKNYVQNGRVFPNIEWSSIEWEFSSIEWEFSSIEWEFSSIE
jgi:hypothetical protein